MFGAIHLKSNAMGVWLFIMISLLMTVNWSSGFLLGRELPCHFLESVNITDGTQQSDGSIIYMGNQFTKNQYTKINYILENGEKRIIVQPYLRGCLCNQKPCIRLCCPNGSVFDPTIETGRKCRQNKAAQQLESDVFDDTHTKVKKISLDQHFAYVDDKPCSSYYLAGEYNLTNVW